MEGVTDLARVGKVRRAGRAALVVVLPGLVACGGGGRQATPTPTPSGTALVVGSVSRDARAEHRRFAPLIELLRSRVREAGFATARLEVVATVPEMAAALADGRVHLYLDSPFPVLAVCRLSGAEPVLRWLKHGLASYRSVIFTRADSGIADLAGLAGARVAFSSPASTSGYLLPRAVLEGHGLHVTEGASGDRRAVHAVFSGDAENTMFWVLERRTEAGALAAEYFERLAGIRRGELRVLATTPEVPRALVAAGPALSGEAREAVVAALVGLGTDPGRDALSRFLGTAGFERLAPGDLTVAEELLETLRADGGAPR